MSQDPGQTLLNSGVNFTPTIHNDTYPAISPSNLDLAGKHVLITGASKGVGRATALSFAKAGASAIAIGARSPLQDLVAAIKLAASQAGHAEPTVLALSLDVTDKHSVAAAAEQVTATFAESRLDILVNNAGYLAPFVPLCDTDPDEWWHDYAVNVKGPYLMTRAFLPLLQRSAHRVLINLTSIGAHNLTPHATAYSPAKLAILRFNELLDHDYGVGSNAGNETETGLLVFGVHPGGVKTDLALRLPGELHHYLVDTAELAGDWMVWLAGERRAWLSGRYVSVTWDVDELVGKREEIVKGDLLKVRLAVNGFGG